MQLVSSIYRYTHSIATAALRYGKARLNHFVPLPTSFHRIGSTFKGWSCSACKDMGPLLVSVHVYVSEPQQLCEALLVRRQLD